MKQTSPATEGGGRPGGTVTRRTLLLAALGALASPPAHAQRPLRIGLGWPQESVVGEVALRFAAAYERESGGRPAALLPRFDLRGPGQLMEALHGGELDVAIAYGAVRDIVPELRVFDIPFLVRDPGHLRRAFDLSVAEFFARRLEDEGLRLLFPLYAGRRVFGSVERPVREPADLEGARISVSDNPMATEAFERYGAKAISLPASEVQLALAKGFVDVYEAPLERFLALRLYEVQRHLSLSWHVHDVAFVLASSAHVERLPRARREALERAGAIAMEQAFEVVERADEAALDRLAGAGMAIHDVERELFRQHAKGSYDVFLNSVKEGWTVLDMVLAVQ